MCSISKRRKFRLETWNNGIGNIKNAGKGRGILKRRQKKKSHKGGKRQKNMEYVALQTKEDNVNKEEKDEHSHML